jgi:hypothetical protein
MLKMKFNNFITTYNLYLSFSISPLFNLMQVTIHNVTESKFFQNQAKTQAPIGTPRNLNTATQSSSSTADAASAKLFGGGSELLAQPAASSIVGLSAPPPPHVSSSTEVFNGSGNEI